MRILSINAGSSSLKFNLIKLPEAEILAKGLFDQISLKGSNYKIEFNDNKIKKEIELGNHEDAINILIKELVNLKIINSLDEINGVGHRVVHGGELYTKSVVITNEVIEGIKENEELAPLHNPANLLGINLFMKVLPNVVHVAVFDTSFHQSMDKEAFLYPIPYEFYEKYKIRKYGFHGTSHKYIYEIIKEHLNNPNLKAIICHLGNGASVTAVDTGKVIDTSMGFTPLAGLMMGTRSGDIDPGIIEYLINKENKDIESVMNILNKKSGLLGISTKSSDSRDIELGAIEGCELCNLAQEMSSRRVANYIVKYNNLLSGADVICFTAGIGENSGLMRELIINKLPTLNLALSDENKTLRGKFKKISSNESMIPIYVIPTDEELMIAKDTYNLIESK